MKKVLTIGGAMHDIFIEYQDPNIMHLHTKQQQSFVLLEEGKKIEINAIYDFVGGGATNAAVSFKRLGFDTTTFFKIGTDNAGDLIMHALQEQNINLKYVIKTENEQTGTSFIIPSESGNKVALVYRGANLTIEFNDINVRAFDSNDLVYITSLSKNASQALKPITEHAKKMNSMIAVNPGGSQLDAGLSTICESLRNIDIFILNAREAQQLMTCLLHQQPERIKKLQGKPSEKEKDKPQLLTTSIDCGSYCFSYVDYFKEVLSRGPRIVVVTNGAEGVYVATQEKIYFYPSPQISVVSSLGAGDAFGSCFAGLIVHGKTIEDSLIGGIYNSCSVITHLGTQTGLLNLEQIEEKIRLADKNLLKTFAL